MTAKVTVGVPAYNAGSFLRECLENLRTQTLSDFRVMIFDNCSSDDTREIALHYTQIDPRFSYHRHERNIGAWPNFEALLDACETDYFLWRAYDDYTDPNYLEELARLLDENPDADLAVANNHSIKPIGRKRKLRITRPPAGPAHGIMATIRLVKGARAAWIYGMWRADVIRERWKYVATHYNHPWGGDFMLMYATLFRGRVAGSSKSTFYQRIIEHEWKSQKEDVATQLAAAVEYRKDAQRFLDLQAGHFDKNWIDRLLYRYLSHWYIEHRIYSGRRVRRKQAKIARAA